MPVTRLRGLNGPAVVFVTTTIINWQPLLADAVAAKIVSKQLGETVRFFDTELYGYVVMPTHIHFLVRLPEIADLSRVVQAFKRLSARTLLAQGLTLGSGGAGARTASRIWMRRFDDLMIGNEKRFWTKLEYIHDNPVKAGLVSEATEWVFSSAADWLGTGRGVIAVSKEVRW